MDGKSEAIGLFRRGHIPPSLFAAAENAASPPPRAAHLHQKRIGVCIKFSKVLITLFPPREFSGRIMYSPLLYVPNSICGRSVFYCHTSI